MNTYKMDITNTSIKEFRLEFESEVDRDLWYYEAICRQNDGHYGIYSVTKGMHITYGNKVIADENALYIVCDTEEFLKLKDAMGIDAWKEKR